MRPSAHFHSAISMLGLIYIFNPSFSIFYSTLFIIGCLAIDLDFLWSLVSNSSSNHRLYITHYPLLYVLLLLLSYLLNLDYLIFLFAGALYHLFFDWFDWGLPIIPFMSEKYMTPHLLHIPEGRKMNSESDFFKLYFNNKFIRNLEIILLAGFLLAFIYLPDELKIIVIIIEVLIVMEFGINLKKVKITTN